MNIQLLEAGYIYRKHTDMSPNICNHCYQELPDNIKFCPYCGTPVEKKMENIGTTGNTKGNILRVKWDGTWMLVDSTIKLYFFDQLIGSYSFKNGFKVDIPITGNEISLNIVFSIRNKSFRSRITPGKDYLCILDYSRAWGNFDVIMKELNL